MGTPTHHSFLQHLFSSEEEFFQGEAAVFYKALEIGFETVLTHAKQKFKSKEGDLKVLVLTPEGENISTLIQNFSTGKSKRILNRFRLTICLKIVNERATQPFLFRSERRHNLFQNAAFAKIIKKAYSKAIISLRC